MENIYADLIIQNRTSRGLQTVTVRALVDTGAWFVVLPKSMKDALGTFDFERVENIPLADGRPAEMLSCGPAMITVNDFPPSAGQVQFCEGALPLLGHWQLQMARVLIDTFNHTLIQDEQRICACCKSLFSVELGK